jgi:hypothetical protein
VGAGRGGATQGDLLDGAVDRQRTDSRYPDRVRGRRHPPATPPGNARQRGSPHVGPPQHRPPRGLPQQHPERRDPRVAPIPARPHPNRRRRRATHPPTHQRSEERADTRERQLGPEAITGYRRSGTAEEQSERQEAHAEERGEAGEVAASWPAVPVAVPFGTPGGRTSPPAPQGRRGGRR